MQRSTAKRRIGNHAPIAAIVLRQGSQANRQSKAGLVLVLFMRTVAAIWIFEGLMQWTTMIASGIDGRSPVMTSSAAQTSVMVFFAIINLVAAVGLWLATPWGGVIWLVSAGAQLFVLVLMPEFYLHPWLIGIVDVALISLYMALTWRVAVGASPPAA